jgi:methionyl-tRNA formyltransferase
MVRAVFMGSDLFSLPVLSRLVSDGPDLPDPVEVVAVIAAPDRPSGRGREIRTGPVASFAQARGIPVQQPVRIRDPHALEALRSVAPELIVVASYGQILPRVVLDEPRHGCLNLHPSLLPKYRGPSPIPAAILTGDEVSGTTLMLMSRRMDAGPILAQETIETGDAYEMELEKRLGFLSGDLLLRELPGWIAGRLVPRPQDEELATYTQLLNKGDGVIDWSLPATQIARMVRAYNPWPGARTSIGGRGVRIAKAHVYSELLDTDPQSGGSSPGTILLLHVGFLLVKTGDGVLAVSELQFAGGRPMDVDAAVRGRPGLIGARFEGVV